ncbi:MAG TPA: hypothetical protein VF781_03665 [Solirubrobacteraceae bacterium]
MAAGAERPALAERDFDRGRRVGAGSPIRANHQPAPDQLRLVVGGPALPRVVGDLALLDVAQDIREQPLQLLRSGRLAAAHDKLGVPPPLALAHASGRQRQQPVEDGLDVGGRDPQADLPHCITASHT